jgi:Family of unknown function (DUF6498)
VSNLIPLAGVVYFHWSLFEVLLLFWLDSVVIGVLSAARSRLAHLERGFPSGRPTPEWRTRYVAKGLFAFFFFTTMHGIFLILLFGTLELRELGNRWMSVGEYVAQVMLKPEIAVAVLATVASRGFDFYINYLRPRAYETAYVSDQMGAAFGRVVVLQLVIIFGGLLIVWLRTPVAALVLLVLLKTAGDLHAFAHRKR